jgi:hypothetical protein
MESLEDYEATSLLPVQSQLSTRYEVLQGLGDTVFIEMARIEPELEQPGEGRGTEASMDFCHDTGAGRVNVPCTVIVPSSEGRVTSMVACLVEKAMQSSPPRARLTSPVPL